MSLPPSNRCRIAVTVGLWLATAVGLARLVAILPGCTQRNDFAHYYVSSRLLLAGEDPYGVPLEGQYARYGFEYDEQIPLATNPPPLLWLFAPLACLPPLAASAVWAFVQLASLAVVLALALSLTKQRLSPVGLALTAAAAVWSAPLYWHVYHSQVQLLLAALLLGAFWLHRCGRFNVACALLAAAGLVKLFPLVLLPWFLWTTGESLRKRIVRTSLVAAGCLAVVLLTDVLLWQAFTTSGLAIVAENAVGRTYNFSLPSLVGNLVHAHYHFVPPASVLATAWKCGVIAGLALIAFGYAVCLWGRQNRERQFCLLTIVMLAGGATMWGHYLVLMIFPCVVAVLWAIEQPHNMPKMFVAAAILTLVCAGTGSPSIAASPMLSVLASYLPLFGLLTLASFFARQLLHGSEIGSTRLGQTQTADATSAAR